MLLDGVEGPDDKRTFRVHEDEEGEYLYARAFHVPNIQRERLRLCGFRGRCTLYMNSHPKHVYAVRSRRKVYDKVLVAAMAFGR